VIAVGATRELVDVLKCGFEVGCLGEIGLSLCDSSNDSLDELECLMKRLDTI
jgi:hypothetical protein